MLKEVCDDLNPTIPETMDSMLDKEDKDEAISKHFKGRQIETGIVPPTCTGTTTGFIFIQDVYEIIYYIWLTSMYKYQ